MAIYHFSASLISRGKGQSAIAAAAYRSGDKLEDDRYGETKFYKRDVRPDTMILAPSHAPEWVHDRQKLWNAVEQSETRKNSQLAREFNVALPKELNVDEQRQLIKGYVQKEFVDRGMVADVAIHRDDPENPHAHVMLTTREIDENGFTKKNRDWNNKDLLQEWREQWSEHANHALERAGRNERITHESNQARRLETLPTVHLGHVAADMEKQGKATDRGDMNRQVAEHNATVIDLAQFRAQKEALTKQAAEREKAQVEAREAAEKKALHQAQEEAIKARIKSVVTAKDKLSLNSANRILGESPTIANLKTAVADTNKKIHELDQSINQIRRNQDTFSKISEQFHEAENTQVRINQATYDLSMTKSTRYGLFKQRQKAEDISRLESRIQLEKNRLEDIKSTMQPYAKEWHFSNQSEFRAIQNKVSDSYQKASSQRMDLTMNRTQLVRAQQTMNKMYDLQTSLTLPTREATQKTIAYQEQRVQDINNIYGAYQTAYKEQSKYKKEHDRNNLTPLGEQEYQRIHGIVVKSVDALKKQGIKSVADINRQRELLAQLKGYNERMEARGWKFEKPREHQREKGWDMER